MDINVHSGVKGAGVAPGHAVLKENREKSLSIAPIESGDASLRVAPENQRSQDTEIVGQESIFDRKEESARVIQAIQERLDALGNTRLGLTLHEDSEGIVVRIFDKESDELIRQIPSEEVLQIRQKLDELIGLLFDQKV